MARDVFIEREQCHYCGRPGITRWDVELLSCSREICEALAFSELKRRNANGCDLPHPVRLGAEPHEVTLVARSGRGIHVHVLPAAVRRARAA